MNLNKKNKKNQSIDMENISDNDIAIIGLSAKMPGCTDLNEFWKQLCRGKDFISDIPLTRKKDVEEFFDFQGRDIKDIKFEKSAYLEDIDKFDYGFFGISSNEASLMDPHHRIFLETAWSAIEDAGINPKKLKGSNTGFFLGYAPANMNNYSRIVNIINPNLIRPASPLILASSMGSRLSHILDLRGPSLVVDTACSSSLVCLHLAKQSIISKECELAMVGGIRIRLVYADYDTKSDIESPNNLAKVFDDSADGTVWSEGAIVILMKPLIKAIKDGDNVHAVVKGSAINNDGRSAGFTTPNPLAQVEVIEKSWKSSGVNPETISYIEAHGTGTELGDLLELEGLERSFSKYTSKKQFCAIGSLKSNIGHLVDASGLASVAKVILMMKNGQIPPTIHFRRPNRRVNLINSPIYINNKLTDWTKNKTPLRAGVSSFGLTGTNCHIVMEEAPSIVEAPENKNGDWHILTLSAETDISLSALIKKYKNYLDGKETINLNNFCHTANAGRMHHDYRIAILFKNLDDLKKKINGLSKQPRAQKKDNRIFQSNNNLNKNKNTRHKIADDKLLKKSLGGKKNKAVLSEICSLYVKGRDINWDQIYPSGKFKKISLPTYSFERNRCWIKFPTEKQRQEKKENTVPLLGKCIERTDNQTIFLAELSMEKTWELAEHKILDRNALPGVCYLEIAAEAFKSLTGSDSFKMENIFFLEPLAILHNETKELMTVMRKENSCFNFSIKSRKISDMPERKIEHQEWTEHASGNISLTDDANVQKMNLHEIIKKCDKKTIKGKVNSKNFQFGPRWDNTKISHIGNKEEIKHLAIREKYIDEAKKYSFCHPALLDEAVFTRLLSAKEKKLFRIPFSYKKIEIYKKLPPTFYSYTKKVSQGYPNDNVEIYDIILLDTNGLILGKITNYTLRILEREKMAKIINADKKNIYYGLEWLPEDLIIKTDGGVDEKSGKVLVFSSGKGKGKEIIEYLDSRKEDLIIVGIGEKFKKIRANKFTISDNQSDYNKLLKNLKKEKIKCIIHCYAAEMDNAMKNLPCLHRSQKRGFYSLLFLARSIQKNKWQSRIDLLLLAPYVHRITGNEERICPENASLYALGKTIIKEAHNIRCRCLDSDDKTTAEYIISELNSNDKIHCPAYRHNQRYIPKLVHRDVSKIESVKNTEIKEGGVYILTGGTGGIGLEISKCLASQKNIILVLIGRSKLPLKELWPDFIHKKENNKISKKIKILLDIEKLGSKIIYFDSDSSDRKKMEKIIKKVRNRYGKIDGIIHGAGTIKYGLTLKKSTEQIENTFSSKIYGTWILDNLTKNDKLDFFLMFSSTGAIFDETGVGDYRGANYFMNSYSSQKRREGKNFLAIMWGLWSNTGMFSMVNQNRMKLHIVRPIEPEEAVRGFINVYNKKMDSIMICNLNPGMMEILYSNLSFHIDSDIKKEQGWDKFDKIKNEKQDEQDNSHLKIKSGEYNILPAHMEKRVASIWCKILEQKSVDMNDNFFSMGGTSMKMADMGSLLSLNGYQIALTDFLQNPTFAGLLKIIKNQDEKSMITDNRIDDTKESSSFSKEKNDNLKISESEYSPYYNCFHASISESFDFFNKENHLKYLLPALDLFALPAYMIGSKNLRAGIGYNFRVKGSYNLRLLGHPSFWERLKIDYQIVEFKNEQSALSYIEKTPKDKVLIIIGSPHYIPYKLIFDSDIFAQAVKEGRFATHINTVLFAGKSKNSFVVKSANFNRSFSLSPEAFLDYWQGPREVEKESGELVYKERPPLQLIEIKKTNILSLPFKKLFLEALDLNVSEYFNGRKIENGKKEIFKKIYFGHTALKRFKDDISDSLAGKKGSIDDIIMVDLLIRMIEPYFYLNNFLTGILKFEKIFKDDMNAAEKISIKLKEKFDHYMRILKNNKIDYNFSFGMFPDTALRKLKFISRKEKIDCIEFLDEIILLEKSLYGSLKKKVNSLNKYTAATR